MGVVSWGPFDVDDFCGSGVHYHNDGGASGFAWETGAPRLSLGSPSPTPALDECISCYCYRWISNMVITEMSIILDVPGWTGETAGKPRDR